MSRSCRSNLLFLAAPFIVLVVSGAGPGPAAADPLLINNGLAPPNSANVIDGLLIAAGDPWQDPVLAVRNAGCTTPSGPCASPGGATTVEIAPGGDVQGLVSVHDTSTLELTGGLVQNIITLNDSSHLAVTDHSRWWGTTVHANDSSHVDMSGGGFWQIDFYDSSTGVIAAGTGFTNGVVAHGFSGIEFAGGGDFLYATESSSILFAGGSVNYLSVTGSAFMLNTGGASDLTRTYGQARLRIEGGNAYRLRAYDNSTVTLAGSDFEICEHSGTTALCAPVGFGLIPATSGFLRGTSTLGQQVRTEFSHNGYSDSSGTYTGQIWLVPEPTTGLLLGLGLAVVVSRRRRH